jgi:hypothetical protein
VPRYKTDNEITLALPPVSMVEYLLLLFYKIYFDTSEFSFYLSGFWTGTVETVPAKRMTKMVGTDLSVPGLTRKNCFWGNVLVWEYRNNVVAC